MTCHRAHDAGRGSHLAYHQIAPVGDEQITRHVHSNAISIVERGTRCSTTVTTRRAALILGSHEKICPPIITRRIAVVARTAIASNCSDDSSSTTNFANNIVMHIQDVQIVRGVHCDIVRGIHSRTRGCSPVTRIA